jgi:hypothetical protein
MGSYWERVTTLVCDIVETCSVLVKMYLICFENTAITVVVYHNGCMTKYLLKSSPKNEQKQDSDLSSNKIAFQNLIHEINDDLVVHKKVFRMTQNLS